MIAIGVDIGGTNTKIGVVDPNLGCLARRDFGTTSFTDSEQYLKRIISEIQILTEEFSNIPVSGIGIGAPGVNDLTGTIIASENIEWLRGFDLAAGIAEYFEVETKLINDANACALGEYKYGVARSFKNFITITLGTGLGGALISNGNLIVGSNGLAGEFGHVNVKPDGRSCNCGKKGCLETYVSASGIKRSVFKLLADTNKKSELQGVTFDDLKATAITNAALQNDPVAVEAFEYTGSILGYKLAHLVAVLDPEAIVISGGLAKAGNFLFDPIIRSLDKNLLTIYPRKPKVLASQYDGATSAILGSASQFLNKIPWI